MSEETIRELAAKQLAQSITHRLMRIQAEAEDYADDIAINGDPTAPDHGGIWDHVKDLEPIEIDVHAFECPNPPPSFGEGYAIAQRITRDTLNAQIERMILECDE